jgi:hypothetical protein
VSALSAGTECRLQLRIQNQRDRAMTGIGRKTIYAILVIVVLLIVWQFLASL